MLPGLCYSAHKCVTIMSKFVRLFFNRKKNASKEVAGAIEIVICLQRERAYFHTGHCVCIDQWKDGQVVNHPRAIIINEDIQKKVTQFEHILIAMEVNRDDMTITQFKTYIGPDGGNRRNFMAWLRERMTHRPLREGTRKGHFTTYKALERFGKFKTFNDITLPHIYEFDLFIREEQTFTTQGKPITRSQAAIHNYHKRFKSYVTEAFRIGLIKENPYDRFQDKRGESKARPHLSETQVRKLIEMREQSTDVCANRYLDFFLFQIFTGLAYSDAKAFDYNQHVVTIEGRDYIDGHRIKTGGEFVTPILPITRSILERNGYKMEVASNQKFNQFLKGIGLALNCPFPLTTHIARHTFACTIALEQGIPKEVLQVMMGHSSIRTTEIYAHLPMRYVSQSIGERMFRAWEAPTK